MTVMGKIKEYYHEEIEAGMRTNIYLDTETKEKAKAVTKAWGFISLSSLIRHLLIQAWNNLSENEKKPLD